MKLATELAIYLYNYNNYNVNNTVAKHLIVHHYNYLVVYIMDITWPTFAALIYVRILTEQMTNLYSFNWVPIQMFLYKRFLDPFDPFNPCILGFG